MAFKYGDNLNFRTDIPLTTWVSGLFPKGQMGMLEDHIGVTIDSAKFQIPMSVAEKLFIEASELVKKEEKLPEKTVKTVKKKKKVKDDGKSKS
tara:strand:- start:1076 stop:1354 length:279 start_codon:yes stop_codon:yes gene_type:complete